MKKTTKQGNLNKKINYRELLYRHQLLQDLMEHVPDVIYFKDRKGRLVLVNSAHAKGLGLKPEEVTGKTDFDIFPKKRAQMMAKDDEHVMNTGKPIIDKIERSTRPDGIDNYVSTTKIPRYDEKGNIIGLIGITRDITQRMQLEHLREEKAQIEKKLEALEELNKMKSEFVSVASHELRTPLAIIKEALMLVFDGVAGPINEKQKELFTKAKDNIERLTNIINELLDISRIERGKFKLNYSLVNLSDLLRDSSDFFKRSAQEKDITLKYSLPKKEVNLFLDLVRINQVLNNLISNAIKFTEEGGEVKVELKVLETRVRVEVSDTGIGIAKQDLPKLFNKFVQIHKEPGQERKGVGLGLSIAKELVERHGGEIWAESKLGVGSRFYFTLPRLYTTDVLDKKIRDKINNLLNKGVALYLINLLIVNIKEFKRRTNFDSKKLFSDLNSIISAIFKDFTRLHKDRPELATQDYRSGECSILVPGATEKEVIRASRLLKERLQRHFVKKSAKDVFIDLGFLPYPPEIKPYFTEKFPANVHIKRIFIGSEVRRYKRVYYRADIEILSPKDKVSLTKTIDISEGGVCFISERSLETDAKIEIKLRVPKRKEAIFTQARIAWIKIIEQLPKKASNKYKVGLEFIGLKDKDKKFLSHFVKSISN